MANTDKTKTLKKALGEAGALLANDTNFDGLYQILKALARGFKNRVQGGLMAAAPTTASTQATGAGATAWRVNVDKGVVTVGGVAKEFAAQADFVIQSATQYAGLVNGNSAVATLVAKKDAAGAITLIAVKGVAAVTGSQVAPSATLIQNTVGAGLDWAKVAECTLNRTGDTTVTQAQDNSKADFGDLVTIE